MQHPHPCAQVWLSRGVDGCEKDHLSCMTFFNVTWLKTWHFFLFKISKARTLHGSNKTWAVAFSICDPHTLTQIFELVWTHKDLLIQNWIELN